MTSLLIHAIFNLLFDLFLVDFVLITSLSVCTIDWTKSRTNIDSGGDNIPLWSAENYRISAFFCWVMESALK
jgi:hypothetical protein